MRRMLITSDGCPSDTLSGMRDTWHTHCLVLTHNFSDLRDLESEICFRMGRKELRPYKEIKSKLSYCRNFIRSLVETLSEYPAVLYVSSIQEQYIDLLEGDTIVELGLHFLWRDLYPWWEEGASRTVTIGPYKVDRNQSPLSITKPYRVAAKLLWMANNHRLFLAFTQQHFSGCEIDLHLNYLTGDSRSPALLESETSSLRFFQLCLGLSTETPFGQTGYAESPDGRPIEVLADNCASIFNWCFQRPGKGTSQVVSTLIEELEIEKKLILSHATRENLLKANASALD